ncbi:MAG TPA: hypothetical protein VJX66_09525 [Amycolatopsis sp.]|nr:hypothetical protein [Amycolatopsis sp.]
MWSSGPYFHTASLADRLGWPVARWYLLRARAARTLLFGDFARATELMERSFRPRPAGARDRRADAAPTGLGAVRAVLLGGPRPRPGDEPVRAAGPPPGSTGTRSASPPGAASSAGTSTSSWTRCPLWT